jgi:hypothetical protein
MSSFFETAATPCRFTRHVGRLVNKETVKETKLKQDEPLISEKQPGVTYDKPGEEQSVRHRN